MHTGCAKPGASPCPSVPLVPPAAPPWPAQLLLPPHHHHAQAQTLPADLRLRARLCKGSVLNTAQSNVCPVVWEPSECPVVAVLQSGWSSLPTRWDCWSTACLFALRISEASSSWAACWRSSLNPASATFKVMYSLVLAQRHCGGV